GTRFGRGTGPPGPGGHTAAVGAVGRPGTRGGDRGGVAPGRAPSLGTVPGRAAGGEPHRSERGLPAALRRGLGGGPARFGHFRRRRDGAPAAETGPGAGSRPHRPATAADHG